MIGILIHYVTLNSLMLGEIISGIGKHGDAKSISAPKSKLFTFQTKVSSNSRNDECIEQKFGRVPCVRILKTI